MSPKRRRITEPRTQRERGQIALRYLTQHPMDEKALQELLMIVDESQNDESSDSSLTSVDWTAYRDVAQTLKIFQRITRRLLRPL